MLSLSASTSFLAITPLKSPQPARVLIDLSALNSTRHRFCKVCIDWTERRPHIAGPVGAALTKRYFDLGWIERVKDSRAVIVTAAGKHGFSDIFGIGLPEGGGTHTQRPAQRQLDSAVRS